MVGCWIVLKHHILAMDASIITVQAQYSFKGSNNDELCFKKGDIITLTQREEGGWWEGTLGDKTGWFPSNYVKEYVGPLPLSETIRPPEEIQAFRTVVFRDLLESEKAHVAELRGLAENFLEPLEGSQILSSNEYTQLMCNFIEVVEMHEEFLQTLEDCNDRVGKVFLSKAPIMKKIHQFYCAAHPRAIVIVDKFREELNVFMEKQGAAKPGLLVLTTGLSKPFRRLDKYSAILQELERHMESGHPDRGDTQRSIAVYKDIASSCSATRRQKELELQILTGPVRGWQGAELSTLGDIIHMGSVAVGPEHKDRYLVLFPQTLLILSVSQRMSAFKYEGKLPLTGITVNRLEDTDQIKNAFEISGTLIDRIVAVCQGPNEANRWVELLSPKSGAIEQNNTGSVDMKRNVSSSAVNIPQPPPHEAAARAAAPDRSDNEAKLVEHKGTKDEEVDRNIVKERQSRDRSYSSNDSESNESLKLPPATGPLSRPFLTRSPCIGDSSNSRSTNSSKTTTTQTGVFPSGGDGLSHRPNISSNGGAARGSGKSMPPPSATGNSHPSRSGSSSIVQHMSQHKRSQSFNHHLSYNQVQQQQLQQQQLKQHQQNPSLLVSPNSLNLNRHEANQVVPNPKGFSEKANWNITNLRPAPPLRPAFLSSIAASSTGATGGGTGGGRSATTSITGSIGGAAASCVGGGSSGGGSNILNASDSVHHSLSFSSSSKISPTYEEDALVLRVIEAYCAAYQSTSRNTMHSALLPWTPCLPIRGGKLKTSKHFSSSNPQLPFTCSSLSSYLPSGGGIKNSRTHTSTNSINSSHIWREANPNSFNMYAASIATLSMPNGVQQLQQPQQHQQQKQYHQQRARYSIGGYGSTEWRSHSEETGRKANGGPRSITTLKTTSQTTGYHNPIARSGSNYDNIFMNTNTNTPLLSRVSKQQTVWMNANQLAGGSLNHTMYQHHHHSPPHHHRHRHRTTSRELDAVIPDRDTSPPPPAPEGGGYIGDYMALGHSSTGTNVSLYDRRLNRSFETAQGLKRNSKISQLRRSTPQLNGDDGENDDEGTRGSLLQQEDNLRDDMSRNSVSCCNKLVRQLQQDMAQVKLQIAEERSQRGHLQQVLMGHLETYGATNTTC
uniref:Guanine nucleotide exchange factor n=1 Tax=Anopheles christyi TaxID=43041 RepID=A0A182JTI5_9DIPT